MSTDAPGIRFTTLELEVLEQLRKGFSDKDIASALGITSRIATFHLASMRKKAGVRTRDALVVAAIKVGIITTDFDVKPRLFVKIRPREIQALQLIAEGKSPKETACAMGIAKRTVDTYLGAIYEIYGVCNRTQALVKALQLGHITLPGAADPPQ
jgi:DNA-binding CsgD family transcriptional regulator